MRPSKCCSSRAAKTSDSKNAPHEYPDRPDSFKGTFTAARVTVAIAEGVRSAGAAAAELPVAGRGEGAEEILGAALGVERIQADTVGLWRDPAWAAYSLAANDATYLNLAAACGINLPAPGRRDAFTAAPMARAAHD